MIYFILGLSLFVGQPDRAFSDYIFMCTFFQNKTAKIFSLSDTGNITFLYNLEVGGNPEKLLFSPDGHWGLIGSNTTYYPPTQKTIVLGVSKDKIISVLGDAHCEYQNPVAISPDSKVGVYGGNMQTLLFDYKDNSFKVTPTNNPILANQFCFSSLSGNIIGQGGSEFFEFMLLDDMSTTTTGFVLDISPSDGNRDLDITPDGKTGIVLSGAGYSITTLKIHSEGGFEKVQEIYVKKNEPQQCEITLDSKYAIISFYYSPYLKSYSIGEDSKLTEKSSITIPNAYPYEDLAVTPDAKYAVLRTLTGNGTSIFHVVYIHPDKTLEFLPDKNFETTGHVSAIDFLPPYKDYLTNSWMLY